MSSIEEQIPRLETAAFAVELAYQYGTLKDIDLHGRTTDEVEHDLDRFITDMFSSNENGCCIVCGTGTGRMKKKVLELLHPYQNGIIGRIIDKGPVLLVVFDK